MQKGESEGSLLMEGTMLKVEVHEEREPAQSIKSATK